MSSLASIVLTGCQSHQCRPDGGAASGDSANPAGAVDGIPVEAVEFQGHHYLIVREKVTWHEAKKRCESMGGQLACIESDEEQRFIAKLAAGKYYYLGATDEASEGTFKWINGSPFEYTKWYDGQPNNYGDEEHYLATYDRGEWVDVAADGDGFWMPKGFICEWEK